MVMKDNIKQTLKKLEDMVNRVAADNAASGMYTRKSKLHFDRMDREILDSARLFASPLFLKPLLDLLKVTESEFRVKVREALIAIGEPAVQDLIYMLDTEHSIQAALVLAEIGDPAAFEPLTRRALDFSGFMIPAVRICTKVGDNRAIEFLIVVLKANKPYGFPKNLLRKEENEGRKLTTNAASKALREITGREYNSLDEWSEWWKNERAG